MAEIINEMPDELEMEGDEVEVDLDEVGNSSLESE